MKETILTEKQNPATKNIDMASSREIAELINNEDKKVAFEVEKEIDNIAKAIDKIAESFLTGGRLLYFGAGTSGRLGVLDASECPPTFGVSAGMVMGYIAGGDFALRHAVEGAEDSHEKGIDDLTNSGASKNDIVVGISAGGNAKYILSILEKAQKTGILTIGIACNKQAKMKDYCDIFIAPEVGEEAITGSTRMKSGTAQKMILNMLTTGAMIKIGKTYKNYMIDLQPTNEKLINRSVRIISEISESIVVPSSIKNIRSKVSLTTTHGIPNTAASIVIPPESVSITAALFIIFTKSKYPSGSNTSTFVNK